MHKTGRFSTGFCKSAEDACPGPENQKKEVAKQKKNR
jgi:hypothetical protein